MPRSLCGSVSWQAAWQAPWQANCHGDIGGGVAIQRASMWHATFALTAGFVRVFGTRPDDPSRASGEGTDGSDPPFLTADAASRGGGVASDVASAVAHPPPRQVGVAPVLFIPPGRLAGPRAGRTNRNAERRDD